jgi:uncharacterized OB-fold protein
VSEDPPAEVPVREGLFRVASDGSARLLGGRCGSCGEYHFPRTTSCPYCSGDGVAEVSLSDTGTLWVWTSVTAPPPGYRGGVPFGFGVVELPEGIRVVTRISEADPSRLRRGQSMRLEVVPLHDGEDGRPVATYAFAPAEAAKPPAEQ